MDVAGLIAWALAHLNCWVVFLLMVMENSVVPLPAELIVIPAAYKAANGGMSLAALIILSTLGSVIGAVINYYLSLWLGRPLIHRFADSRWGRLLFLDSRKLEYAEELFRRHGNVATFVGRLLPAGRQFVSVPAGLARVNIGAFLFYTAAGSAIWNSLLIGVGYYLSYLLPEEEALSAIQRYGVQINAVFFGLLILLAVYFAVRRIVRHRSK